VAAGLVIGKLLGIGGATLLALRLGVGRLPAAVTTRHVVGLAAVAGVGFTVSVFVTGLAFDDSALQGEAKVGVLVASVLAALIGSAILRTAPARD
jgi:NhaA family Na+:H+ antiporter